MQRIPEPELMDGAVQAMAYAQADFADPDTRFLQSFEEFFGTSFAGEIADLGCGPGNITFRLAQACHTCRITGIDGARSMLDIARERVTAGLPGAERTRFVEARLPDTSLPAHRFGAVVSNSLLHHLHDPMVLWSTVAHIAKPGAAVLIADLRRPVSLDAAQHLTETYAANAPEVLRHDFHCSLLAAFEPAEVEVQLTDAGLEGLRVRAVGDRHLEVWGRL